MKTILFAITIFSMLALNSCQKETKLTDDQKHVIIREVKAVFESSLKGIEERNADIAFAFFSKQEGTKYIRDGHLYPNIDTAKNEYAKWFSQPGPKQKVNCDPIIFDVLDKNTVLVTTIGSIVSEEKINPDQKPWVIAYTMLFRKEPAGWKVFHMHNSWQ